MTRRATAPPPGDNSTPVAPDKPPGWRHALWPLAAVLCLVLFVILPVATTPARTTLTYSQFMADVSAKKIKTVRAHR